MPRESAKELIENLLGEADDVRTTVFELGDAKLEKHTRGDLCILTVSGLYSRNLGKEIERLCLNCSSDLGLEFTHIKSHPATQTKFDSSVVGVLRNIRDKFRTRKKRLLLCMPPSELVDLLKLTGVYDGYEVVDQQSAEVFARSQARGGATAETVATGTGTTVPAAPAQDRVGRKILELNHSLKRTACLEKGLESAEKCVKHFLPKAPPEVPGYSFAFSYKSSERVGGDFFDFLQLPDGQVGVVIGDVSGHGLDAAILMGITKKVISLRALDPARPSPREVLSRAAVDLAPDFNKYNFVTVLYARIDPQQGTVQIARAGHEMPIHFGAGLAPAAVESRGLPIGPASSRTFSAHLEEKSIQLQRGERIFFFTDGIAECWSPRGETFGRARLIYNLGQVKPETACQPALDALLRTVGDFAADRAQEDDMTAILVQRA